MPAIRTIEGSALLRKTRRAQIGYTDVYSATDAALVQVWGGSQSMISLGLDIGTNSVGSAWVDTETREIAVGVSVFPAGVDEADDQRGAPKNQTRRAKRSLRRNLARRSERKRRTRRLLVRFGLLPIDPNRLQELFDKADPWLLRERGVQQALNAHEFGRVLLHLCQRRGAFGLKDLDPQDSSDVDSDQKSSEDADAKVKAAVKSTKLRIRQLGLRTFGQLVAQEMRRRARPVLNANGAPRIDSSGNPITYQHDPIRNRPDSFLFHADRSMIREEFLCLWEKQCEPGGALSHLNQQQRAELLLALDNPARVGKWRHQGTIFGQRATYWNAGTLGRCTLEPTERCVPIADRHASYYRVLETVNNVRIQGPQDRRPRPLTPQERSKLIERLRTQKTGTVAAVRGALGIDKRSLKKQGLPENAWRLNLEHDEEREINTDWFHREIVGALGTADWDQWPENKREGLNRALLKCDPAVDEDENRLREILHRMEVDVGVADRLIAAWKTRPKLEKRLNLSRRAVLNLLPYMEKPLPDGRWPTQIEARQMFADDPSNGASDDQRRRYRIGAQTLTKADRRYLKKHPGELPPAPMLSNPVVRKAIHEVRRHVIAHMRAHGGRKPDRICIEFAREAKKSKKVSDWILALNRKRERIRKQFIEEFVKPAWGHSFHTLSHNQIQSAVDRVILARQQQGLCAYSGDTFGFITPHMAARGDGLEIDHIIPKSRGGPDAWSNLVLCWRESNRDKGNKTPREWWGDEFDRRSRALAFMNSYEPAKGDRQEYFTKRDYAAKWLNFSREDVPQEWRGSQLTDAAFASRQVQSYLQAALWPDEKSHLEGGPRRIFVTIGAYTHQLRKDWQLFQRIIKPGEATSEDVLAASLKNRGDHREHAVDAVAIAFTAIPADETFPVDQEGRSRTRLQDLARHQQIQEEEWRRAKQEGRDPRGVKRIPLPVPWGDVKSFRRQVLSLIYGNFEGCDDGRLGCDRSPIVISHRPFGRRILDALHEDMLFSPVPEMKDTFVGRKSVLELTPDHLRPPVPEKTKDSIKRLTAEFLRRGITRSPKQARALAKAEVASPWFTPLLVDPPPAKSGLVRDRALRQRLRDCIASYEYVEKDSTGNITKRYFLNPDCFKRKEIKQAFEAGAIKHASGVPIKRVKLLRTIKKPVVVHRRRWDDVRNRWVRDTGNDGDLAPNQRSRSDRAYVGGKNHHIEIREDGQGNWTGTIVTMFEAAQRVRREKLPAVDRLDDPHKGGRFIMSLAQGETVCMRHKETGEVGYFVVFKLDQPQTIHFKWHWDARRDKGEKDDRGQDIPGSKREDIPVTAKQLKSLAPPDAAAPYKVAVDPLGNVRRIQD